MCVFLLFFFFLGGEGSVGIPIICLVCCSWQLSREKGGGGGGSGCENALLFPFTFKPTSPSIQKEYYSDDGLSGYTVSSLKAVRRRYILFVFMVGSFLFSACSSGLVYIGPISDRFIASYGVIKGSLSQTFLFVFALIAQVDNYDSHLVKQHECVKRNTGPDTLFCVCHCMGCL